MYPASKRNSRVPRLTVPACRDCNASWSDDEVHFRDVLVVAGPPNDSVRELWRTTVKRSFEKDDGRRRFIDLWEQLKAINTRRGERHQIFPANDDRFLRVLRKIIRGLHFHHFRTAVSGELVGVNLLRYEVPQEFLDAMPIHHREQDILQYRYETFEAFEDTPMRTAWLLTFFDNRNFAGWVLGCEHFSY